MKSIFEQNGGTYTQVGDYLILTSLYRMRLLIPLGNMAGCGMRT